VWIVYCNRIDFKIFIPPFTTRQGPWKNKSPYLYLSFDPNSLLCQRLKP